MVVSGISLAGKGSTAPAAQAMGEGEEDRPGVGVVELPPAVSKSTPDVSEKTRSERSDPSRKQPGLVGKLAIPAIALITLIQIIGFSYYRLSPADRLDHALDSFLKPGGIIGQPAGILAFTLFLFLWFYPIRKRFRFLSFTGPVSIWLELHIVAGLLIPFLGATHAAWRFNGLVGLGFGAMFLVCCSGVGGRFLYSRIPRTREGVELTIDQINRRRVDLLAELVAATGLEIADLERRLAIDQTDQGKLGIVGTFRKLIRDDRARKRAIRTFGKEWGAKHRDQGVEANVTARRVLNLARRQMALSQRVRILDSTHKIFGYWHAAHKPVAITAFAAIILHVTVVTLMGATWFW